MSRLRPLIIDDAARAKAAAVVAYAMDHPYVPGKGPPPGDDPGHVAVFDTYRAVFSFTHTENGQVYRHLSISVPSKGYPNPAAAFAIAGFFGFTGWDERTIDRAPEGWGMLIHDDEHCLVLAQQVN